jgi:RNA-dependent RNA polymerase
VDCRLTGRQLNYRPSMLKFESSASVVEICAVARLLPAYLNRQVITLLTGNGVPEAVFEDMHHMQLELTLASLHNATQARALLLGGCDGGFISTAGLRELLRAGVDPLGDPFLRGMLRAVLRSKLHDLRTRTRIFVEQGVNVIGIMDELGLLQYGEVYLHCSGGLCLDVEEALSCPASGDPYDPQHASASASASAAGVGERPPERADLLVTRCPCLHPGDVRVLRAVPLEDLVHRAGGMHSEKGRTAHNYFSALPNVLVFPQKGSKPHPSECSGGDLDGDLYLALWDTRLLPPLHLRNHTAMDYSAPPPQISPIMPVSERQITDFFVHFIQNDCMGRIARYTLRTPHSACWAASTARWARA